MFSIWISLVILLSGSGINGIPIGIVIRTSLFSSLSISVIHSSVYSNGLAVRFYVLSTSYMRMRMV